MNNFKITALAAIVLSLVLAPATAKAQLPFGETKEFQDASFSLNANFIGPDGSSWFPLNGNKRKVPTVKGARVVAEFAVMSNRSIDGKGNPKYKVSYQYGPTDGIRYASYHIPALPEGVRRDGKSIQTIVWTLDRRTDDFPLGDTDLIITIRDLVTGRARNVIVVPWRGHDVTEGRQANLTFTGVEYKGPCEITPVMRFLAARAQEEASGAPWRTKWIDSIDNALHLETLVEGYVPPKPPSPADPKQGGAKKPGQPEAPAIDPVYGEYDSERRIFRAYAPDRDVIVEVPSAHDGSGKPYKKRLAKGHSLKLDFSDTQTEQIVQVVDAATGTVLYRYDCSRGDNQ